ncbi:MAG: site-2 protease family protein [Clostridiales bacterium]|nr:site-2 protease family protein [Candidatus Crickella equi]
MSNLFGDLYMKILTLPGIIIGLSFHEFAHAWMSNKLGDPTPRMQGRLTVSPLAHVDLIGFVCLLICGFGWGKPVMIDPRYYKKRRRDELLVALAGVIMNLLLAIIFSFPTKWLYSAYSTSGNTLFETLFYICMFIVQINLCLMIFNLIPVPPLDGWGILTQLVDLEKYRWYPYVYQYGGWFLLLLILFDVTDIVLMPCINFFMNILF